ncbi:hypothetical protein DMUE_3436 [Dictyocoela muelleri]|nr:hypothetical protein DMUE_3436 [Dictyocoela muelleri]
MYDHGESRSYKSHQDKLNKNKVYESLYSFYCKYHRVPRETDIMSSWKTFEEAIMQEEMEPMASHDNERNRKEATFEYVSTTTGLRIQHKMTILTNIAEQDLLKWVSSFKEISRMCNWQEEAKVEVLSQIVCYEIISRILPRTSYEEILNSLLKLEYNLNKSHHYYQKLSNIHQKNFLKIRTYAEKIRETCHKLGICCDWS